MSLSVALDIVASPSLDVVVVTIITGIINIVNRFNQSFR